MTTQTQATQDEQEFEKWWCEKFVPADVISRNSKNAYFAALSAERERSKCLVEALDSVFNALPGNQEGYACNFCDMGGAGYSQFGDGFHDDKCHYWKIQEALNQYRGESTNEERKRAIDYVCDKKGW